MTTKEVVFDGSPPWGFRMNGGADSTHPLRISRVNPGSKAEARGVREGDLITSINGQPTKSLNNSDSHALLRTVKENLRLGLNENQNGLPRRRSKDMKASPVASEKDLTSAPANKENTKPSRSKLRRQRKKRLQSLLKEKLLGYKETPGQVLTSQPVPEDAPCPGDLANNQKEKKTCDNPTSGNHDKIENVSAIEDVSATESNTSGLNNGIDNFGYNAQPVEPANKNLPSATDQDSKHLVQQSPAISEGGELNVRMSSDKSASSGRKTYDNVSYTPQQVQHAEVHVWLEKPSRKENSLDFDLIESVKTIENDVNVKQLNDEIRAPEESGNIGKSLDHTDTVFLSSSDMMDLLSSDENVYDLAEADIQSASIVTEENDQLGPYLETLGHQELHDVNARDVRIYPLTEIPAYFLPPRRYLDVICEENSDLSDCDRPWENSEKIRQINSCIDTIPEDWYGSQDGIDTSWRDGKSLEEMSDIPVVTDSHSDSELIVEDVQPTSKNPSDGGKTNSLIPPSASQRKTVRPSTENVVKNVVSSFYTSKQTLKPIQIETVQDIRTFQGPNSDVVEIVYLDSSDSEAISSSKSDTNLAALLGQDEPLVQEEAALENDVASLETGAATLDLGGTTRAITGVTDTYSEGLEEPPKIGQTADSSNIAMKNNDSCALQKHNNLREVACASDIKNACQSVQDSVETKSNQGSAENSDTCDSDAKRISEIISGIAKSANDLLHSKDEPGLNSPSAFVKRKNVSSLQTKASERCSSAPILDLNSPRGLKTTRSECSDGDDYPCFICYDSDTSSQSTTKPLQSGITSLKELSMTAVLRLPFGISFLKQLGFDQSEYDSYSGYMPEGSEFSFSSKQPMSEGDYVLEDESDNEVDALIDESDNEESISNSLPSRPVPEYQSPRTSLSSTDRTKLGIQTTPENRQASDRLKTSNASQPNMTDLLDLHRKFCSRRGYHESDEKSLDKYDRRIAYKESDTEYYSEFLALREYHALRQRKMKEAKLAAQKSNEGRNQKETLSFENSDKDEAQVIETSNAKDCERVESINIMAGCVDGSNRSDIGSADDKECKRAEEVVDNSRLLELIQSDDFKGSHDELNMPAPTYPYWILLEQLTSADFKTADFFKSLSAVDDSAFEFRREKAVFDYCKNRPPNSTKDVLKLFGSQNDVSSSRRSSGDRPKSVPPSGEIFRQKMYDEYMNKLAELSQRRRLKAIKLTEPVKPTPAVSTVDNLRCEFMERVRERKNKLGLTDDFVLVDSSILKVENENENIEEKKLPKHVQELIDVADEIDIIGKDGLLVEIDQALSPERKGFLTAKGVWSPVHTPDSEKKPDLPVLKDREEQPKKKEEEAEQTPPIWTPKSAGPSPTLGRKFRPVNFQSPPPQRKDYSSKKADPELELPKDLPATSASNSSSRLISSTSENSTLTSTQLRLPSSQNPTITLLQKAREGQIPKGAQYLDDASPNHPHSTGIGADEIVYSVKKEYSTADDEGVKKIVELTPKKFSGIGPTTKDGVPIGLRSEVNENNQQRWYKRMYDSLHKTADRDKDFVTVRYKTRRKDQYPYSAYSGGYASEPERLGGYDSDASLSKYATLDRRKIRNKENDFTTSTLPRNKYVPSTKHAVNIYKNQPGRIEDYEPGNSSIAEIEKNQWWDEVLDIFDGELNNSSKTVYATPSRQSFTTYALKDTGYDSDSTLVFKRRENMSENLSPAEQKMAYKVIQRGGEVPLHGLRKTIPERPKEESEIEYFPLSPTLTRIRVHKKPTRPKEKVFYPVSPDQPLFGAYKRTARSAVIPSPPRRLSSRNNSTLRLYTKISTSKSPDSGSGLSDKTAAGKEIDNTGKTKNLTKQSDPLKYAVVRKKEVLRKSPELKAPAEVKKALKDSTKSSGTVVKSSTTLYSSSTSKKPNEDKSVKVTVAISSRGKDFLTSSSSASSKSDVRKASPLLTPSATKKSSLVSKKLIGSSQTSLTKSASRPSSRASAVSTGTVPELPKKLKKESADSKKKKDKKPEIILKNMDKVKEDDKKKSKKKLETAKKKNGTRKKDKENVPVDTDDVNMGSGCPSETPPKPNGFFQQLLLKDRNTCVPVNVQTTVHVQRTPSVSERAKMFDQVQHQTLYKSEPSLRNLNVYLSHRKPVSESRFRSLDRGESRTLSPFYGTIEFFEKLDKFDKHNNVWDPTLCYSERAITPTYESIKGRSSSEPPCTSPSPTRDATDTVSPSLSRSPSCRRIRRSTNKTIESIAGLKRKVRSKSLNEAEHNSQVGSCSSLSISHATDHTDYHSYVFELLHSQPKSERFKELHNFYSSLERMAELEKTTSNTDLRPRLKGEEVIDFDRWKQLRNKERAELEWSSLYHKLMEDQREKDLLFLPKEATRWQGDRGLRNKEKSVEDLRQKFQKLASSSDSDSKRDSISTDVYKPLWRGNSVVNLAHSLTSVVGSKRGRPICEATDLKEELPKIPQPKPSKEIGSRLWSSLSMEQVNALKCQLSEIYNTVSNLKHERIQKIKQNIEDYEMNIAELGTQDSSLQVRSNSLVGTDQLYSPAAKRRHLKKRETLKADSIGSIPSWKSPKPLTEPEKRKLSMTLCAEVKERIKKKKHGSLVIPRETLGAVAAIKGTKKLKSPCQSDASPRTCYSLMSDDSNDKRSDKRDYLLVLTPKEQQNEVKKNMDDWGGKEFNKMIQMTPSSSSSSASTVIHLGSKDDFKSSSVRITDLSQSVTDLKDETSNVALESLPNRGLYSSQSYTDLKDLFGEKQATTYATQPLKDCQKSFYNSADSLCKSATPDPSKYYRAYLSVVKAGDVRKLREKFESYDDIYNLRKESPVQKRFQSDPDLTRDFLSRKGGEMCKVVIKGQELGDVQWLRKKYEARKGSPVAFKNIDRYMPHINVISKTAELQQCSLSPQPKNEKSRTGNVERLKRQFERRHGATSLLGQMYTSTPEIAELRDIAPYLECDWVAHKNVRSPKPTRRSPPKKRPASTSPVRQSILKNADIFANQPFNPEIHRPLYRYQPEMEPDRNWHSRSWNIRPTVTFKEPIGNPIPTPPRDHASRLHQQESPHRYVESEVNIHYKSPVRSEAKVAWPEDELAEKQAEIMRRIYQEQRRTKYLNELHDMYSRRHTDNLLPSQKSPIPLNRYDDFPLEPHPPRPRDRTPEPKLVARAMYNFIGQTPRELSFRRGDIIYVRRQIDKHWYEGEHNAMIGLFPFNYVEIIPFDGIRTLPRKANEGQARAKFNFQAQTHLELSLVKGELVLLTRRVDENWFEGRIGNRKGIFPVSYVEVLVEPGEKILSPSGPISTKPIVAPASHSVMLNGAKDIGQQHYQPPRPALYSSSSLPPHSKMSDISLVSQSLHIDTQSDPVPYRVLYNYRPQNDDELELKEGDVVYVMEKCDDGWYVGSLHRNGQFGTFPGNYVERII